MSAKTSTQQGRRTPLSLTGAVTKSHSNKGVNNSASNGSGNSSNGNTAPNSNKQDNKLQQQKADEVISNTSDIKENPNKKLSQTDKKQQQADHKKTLEKNQNGVNSNKQHSSNESKQQQQLKEKPQPQNGSDSNKLNEKDKKEKSEKSDKMEKSLEKSEKDDIKSKEDKILDQSNTENKRDEKIAKDIKEKDLKEDKKQEQQQPIKDEDKKSKEETQIKVADKKPEEIVQNMDIIEDQYTQKKSTPVPVAPKSGSKTNKVSGSVNKTPIKVNEKTPQKTTPTNKQKTPPVTKREETSIIDDDIEMEPLAVESSPIKSSQPDAEGKIKISPSATSTPGKLLLHQRNYAVPKTDMQYAIEKGLSPERPKPFFQISGRKSIRPISDYTPSKFQSNLQYRESYRRINTELDVTNTSMNVTVGSEAATNLSFSFFGRGRKRERTPLKYIPTPIGGLQTDVVSPPKRARLDMYGIFSVVSSPLALLRNRFSKASLQSSTPVKHQQKLNVAEDEIEVQNVSGVSMHEEIPVTDMERAEAIASINDRNDATIGEEIKETNLKTDIGAVPADKELKDDSYGKICEQSDNNVIEISLQPAVGDPMAKNKKCIVM